MKPQLMRMFPDTNLLITAYYRTNLTRTATSNCLHYVCVQLIAKFVPSEVKGSVIFVIK